MVFIVLYVQKNLIAIIIVCKAHCMYVTSTLQNDITTHFCNLLLLTLLTALVATQLQTLPPDPGQRY